MMAKSGYTRLFITQIVISALFSAAFGASFTWILFGTAAVATSAARSMFVLDFVIQAFMTALFAYAFPWMAARASLRKDVLAPLPSPVARVGGVPVLVQTVLVALLAAATLGAAAAALAHFYAAPPIANATVRALKIAFGVTVSTTVSILAVFVGLAPKGRSGATSAR